MKRSKVCIEQITDLENCKKAITKAAKGKKKRRNVRRVLEHLDEYAAELSRFLAERPIRFSPGASGHRKEGTKQKDRIICRPRFFPDQCAHWAIMLIVGPELEKRFYRYSCASIKGRGTHYAAQAIRRATRDVRGTKYCLQLDFKSFYASIDRGILLKKLSRTFKDWRIVEAIRAVLYAYKGDGLPLGWYTSAHFANFYLTQIDRFVKEERYAKHYVRYMDDEVIYGANKRKLHAIRKDIDLRAAQIVLRVKQNWQVYKMPYVRGHPTGSHKERRRATDFVGFRFYRYKTTIRRAIFLQAARNLRAIAKGKYNIVRARRYMAYNGYIAHSDSASIRRNYIDGKIKISKLREEISREAKRFGAGGICAARI